MTFNTLLKRARYILASTLILVLLLPYPRVLAGNPPKKVPVLFVPGFGASINLPVLTLQPGDIMSTSGWRFFDLLTPSYTQLLHTFEANGIPYKVAYYDWRIPAEEAEQEYLLPALTSLEAEYGVNQIDIVAHSFGGLVARTYLQSSGYKNDVRRFIEIGTPNEGSAMAYAAWEGGEAPKDLSPLNSLIRFYQYRDANLFTLSAAEALRKYFPSVQELLPTYPYLSQNNVLKKPEELKFDNVFLRALNQNADILTGRAVLISVISGSEPTLGFVAVGKPQASSTWPDGKPSSLQPPMGKTGDGTVTLESAYLPNSYPYIATGPHADLPGRATSEIVALLNSENLGYYPPDNWVSPPKGISFFFDCPVSVEIVEPDGKMRSSLLPDSADIPGEVASSDGLLWMVMPHQEGTYDFRITALADTPVRAWVDDSLIRSVNLKKNETVAWHYQGATQQITGEQLPQATSTPSPAPKPIAQATPSPSTTPSASPAVLIDELPSNSPQNLETPVAVGDPTSQLQRLLAATAILQATPQPLAVASPPPYQEHIPASLPSINREALELFSLLVLAVFFWWLRCCFQKNVR